MKEKIQFANSLFPSLRVLLSSLLTLILTCSGLLLSGLAVGVWIIPDRGMLPMLTLMNLALSVLLLIIGLCCLAFAYHRLRAG
ncbi:hypothetical protein [Thetidibacter halocola]|uniref:Uncharacterized protein n=1 Tax=Thetidibacter halocola TaxID=2827239 RepID=A0A8J7WAX7_9RHOB|nr:hypothetical protein [Thetidibacter halocola]MBS0124205.1 hypothetical protein [Thetidibacter halocola]